MFQHFSPFFPGFNFTATSKIIINCARTPCSPGHTGECVAATLKYIIYSRQNVVLDVFHQVMYHSNFLLYLHHALALK